MKKYLYILIFLFPLFLCSKIAVAKGKPTLIVKIVVDGIRYDNFVKYSKNYLHNGFGLFAEKGTQYTNARHNSIAYYPFVGVASIMTGATASQSGVVGLNWVNHTTNKSENMFLDYNSVGIGTKIERGTYSPKKLNVQTVGDLLRAKNDSSKVVSIAHDLRNAIIAGGSNPTDVFWLDTMNMRWVTSSYYRKSLPKWLEIFNKSEFNVVLGNRGWEPQVEKESYVNHNSEVLFKKKWYSSVVNYFSSKGLDYHKFEAMPHLDDYLFEMAKKAIVNDSLGMDTHPDLMILSLSGLSKINNIFGNNSCEAEDAYYNLDRNISELNTFLSNTIGKDNYTIVFTGSCGTSDDIVETERSKSGRFNTMQFKVMMNSFLAAQFGYNDLLIAYSGRNIYLNRKLIFEKRLSLSEIRDRCATFALQFAGVAHTYTSSDVKSLSLSGAVHQRVANSFHPKYSGDIVVKLLPNWIEINIEEGDVVSNSGSGYNYDTHVPLLFYGNGISKESISSDVSMIDVAPTVCEIFNIGRTDISLGYVLKDVVPISIMH